MFSLVSMIANEYSRRKRADETTKLILFFRPLPKNRILFKTVSAVQMKLVSEGFVFRRHWRTNRRECLESFRDCVVWPSWYQYKQSEIWFIGNDRVDTIRWQIVIWRGWWISSSIYWNWSTIFNCTMSRFHFEFERIWTSRNRVSTDRVNTPASIKTRMKRPLYPTRQLSTDRWIEINQMEMITRIISRFSTTLNSSPLEN